VSFLQHRPRTSWRASRQSSRTFQTLRTCPTSKPVYQDADEWGPRPWKRGAPILHIELRRWADLLVIAPLSVNTMAKIAGGMCDNADERGACVGRHGRD
jgi:phosphopantothenoylcysteine decarboxylase